MAATVPEYVVVLLPAQNSAAIQLGVDLYAIGRETYVSNLAVLTIIGVLMKALNDHGVVLDAEWQTRLNGALAGSWPAWLLNQQDPNVAT
jgi:hypothetical protein